MTLVHSNVLNFSMFVLYKINIFKFSTKYNLNLSAWFMWKIEGRWFCSSVILYKFTIIYLFCCVLASRLQSAAQCLVNRTTTPVLCWKFTLHVIFAYALYLHIIYTYHSVDNTWAFMNIYNSSTWSLS